jgi:hypothetical protein
MNNKNPFKPNPWYKKIYYHLIMLYKRLRYPENVWYGYGLKRESALKSVGGGWSKLINNLYDAKPKHTIVTQVKEKFGTLRFYISNAPEWYYDLIDHYEQESATICEQCGKDGKTRLDRGWYLTLCDECYEKDKNL